MGAHPPGRCQRNPQGSAPPPPAGGPHPRRCLPSPTRANRGGTGGSARAPSPAGGGDITATAGGAASRASLPRRLPPARTDRRTTGGRWTAARGPRTGAGGRRERGVRGPRPSAPPTPWRARRLPPPTSCPARPGASTPGGLGERRGRAGTGRRGPPTQEAGAAGPEQRRRRRLARNVAGTPLPVGRRGWGDAGCRRRVSGAQGAPGRRKGSPRLGALGLPQPTPWKPAREGRLGGGQDGPLSPQCPGLGKGPLLQPCPASIWPLAQQVCGGGLPGLLSPAWLLLPTATGLVGRGPRVCHGWGRSPPTHQVPLLQQIAAGLGLQSQAAGWVCACLKRCLPGAGSQVMPAARALRPAPIRDDGVALPLGRVPAW